MGRRGPPPKPTALKDLHGTRRKDREPRNEPKPPTGTLECPRHLGPVARAAWRRLEPVLLESGLLTLADGMALELLCTAYEEWYQAHQLIRRKGLILTVPAGKTRVLARPNPAVAMRADAYRRLLLVMREFGLTPGSRGRVESDPLAALGFGKPTPAGPAAVSPAAPTRIPPDPHDPLSEFAPN